MKKRRIRVTLGVTINAGNYQNYRPEVEASAQLERGEDMARAYRRLSLEAFGALVKNTMGLMANQLDWRVREALSQIGVIEAEQDELLLKRAEERAALEVELAKERGDTVEVVVVGDDGVIDEDDDDEDDVEPDDYEEVEREDFGGELEDVEPMAQEAAVPVTDEEEVVECQDCGDELPVNEG